MMNNEIFGTAVNCIDGRAQSPVTDWLKLHCQLDYVDMVTLPGADRVLSEGASRRTARVERKVLLSVKAHLSQLVAVAGHFDCAANPVGFEEHKRQIVEAAKFIESWDIGVRVVGLYVNEWNSVDLITDSDGGAAELRSFL